MTLEPQFAETLDENNYLLLQRYRGDRGRPAEPVPIVNAFSQLIVSSQIRTKSSRDLWGGGTWHNKKLKLNGEIAHR